MQQSDEQMVQRLVQAVGTIMDPMASNQHRQLAQQICEDFKENAKSCAAITCGFFLGNANNSPFVRHFGLQVVEHCIKYRWNELAREEKDHLKQTALLYIDNNMSDMLEEAQHIKDAVSRIMVELIKREWPQQWTGLFSDFSVLCDKGPKQTEVILQTMLRLAEDVVFFNNLPGNRKSDVTHALTLGMGDIFSFFNSILIKYLAIYSESGGAGPDGVKACKICNATLETYSGYLDWVPVKFIVEFELIPKLCSLLLDKELALKASECILIIVGRKGALLDRKDLLIIFQQEPMNFLLQASNNASAKITESSNFLFLKRVCEIMYETGKQLSTLWGQFGIAEPTNFKLYLDVCIVFLQHPSQVLRRVIIQMWAMFLRHTEIPQNETFLSILPTLIECFRQCLFKVGYPSQNNSVSCEYSRLDFDNDREFYIVLTDQRVSTLDTMKLTTVVNPELMFTTAYTWLKEELSKPIVTSCENNPAVAYCKSSSPSALNWEACCAFLDNVVSRLFYADLSQPFVQRGLELLNNLLDYQVQDPLILSSALSCMSCLFPFIKSAPDCINKVVEKTFRAVAFNLPGQTKSTRSQAVRNVRLHACSIIINICKMYTQAFVPEFKNLHARVKQLDSASDAEQLSSMEKHILEEALIIVLNQFHNFEFQSAFIGELLQPVKDLWTSAEFTQALSSTECFMSYVGLNQPAVEPSSADICGINRSQMSYCINTILSVIKRCQCPQEFAVAQQGGFVVSHNGSQVMRNPATPHIVPLLDNLLGLLKSYCCLAQPNLLSLRHPDFFKAYEIQESDCNIMLGINAAPTLVDNTHSVIQRQPVERMQNFLSIILSHGFQILGSASNFLGLEFYSLTALIQSINETIITNLSLLPDHKLKIIIHNFIKPLMENCPPALYSTVCVPFLSVFCPILFERLKSKWQIIAQRSVDSTEDEHQESQEVLEDHILKSLNKEYFSFLSSILFTRNKAVHEVQEEEAMERDAGDSNARRPASDNVYKQLNDLGMLVFSANAQNCYASVVMFLLAGLSFPDTWTCLQCVMHLWNVCLQLDGQGEMSTESHQHVFMSILSGLQLNGMDTHCETVLCSLALRYYEKFGAKYPVLGHVLKSVPGASAQLIAELDHKLRINPLENPTEKPSTAEKKRRKMFKTIVENIVGKDIGEKFRRTAQYAILPKLFLENRRKEKPLPDDEEGDLGLCGLFAPSDSS